MRQTEKRTARNTVIKAEIHSLRVKLRKLVDAKKHSEAAEIAKLVSQKFDKAVSKDVLKKNTAARIKSRLMKKVNAIKSK